MKVAEVLIIVSVLLMSCKAEVQEESIREMFKCGAETLDTLQNGDVVYELDGNQFYGCGVQTDEYVFEGESAMRLDKTDQYGMSLLLTNIRKGTHYKATVWEKDNPDESKGGLAVKAEGNTAFTLTSIPNGIFNKKDGWHQHFLSFSAVTDLDSITFFLFAGNGRSPKYFDEMVIEQYPSIPDEGLTTTFNILLTEESEAELAEYINEAAGEEIIVDDIKNYVDATLVVEEDSMPVEMRLKGDWTDHLISGSPSYRIKTESGYAFKGMRSFSIQLPKTRNFMYEWFMHRLCDKHDLLSTRYDFMPVKVNDEYKGVYAMEEHFDKQLLESRNFREGPILKMDETAFWATAVLADSLGLEWIDAPFFEGAISGMFKSKRTRKSPQLFAQFSHGVLLLDAFKRGELEVEDIFDVNRLAMYYALIDLGGGEHALAWHNRRFYYNPVTGKLEHIGFDMIPDASVLKPTMIERQVEAFKRPVKSYARIDYRIFASEKFRKAYFKALAEITAVDYLDQTFAWLDEEIKEKELLLQAAIPYYHFDRQSFYERARVIRNKMDSLIIKGDKFGKAYRSAKKINAKEDDYVQGVPNFYLSELSINAYRSELLSGHFQIEFENFHPFPVEVVGYSVKQNKDSIIYFSQPKSLAGFSRGKRADAWKVKIPNKPSRVFFKPKNLNGEVKKKKLIKWGKPSGEHPRLMLAKGFKEQSEFYQTKGKEIHFVGDTLVIDQLIYIPKGYNVHFAKGLTIDLIKGGGLILNGSTYFGGTEAEPITITSSDVTGQGVTILQADTVDVQHTAVTNMRMLDHEGWTLTGAFTVYEANVNANYLSISGNRSEDALNLIRCHFEIKNATISNTQSDGFDADFCTGSLDSSTFLFTGNDCIDFSGSVVDISNITIRSSGDKGVSAGEASNLTVTNITIDGAITGLASKDKSVLTVSGVLLKNAEVGAAAFMKKPEYGSSSIFLKEATYQNVDRLSLLEKGSEITWGDKTFKGYQKLDVDQLYERFEKK